MPLVDLGLLQDLGPDPHDTEDNLVDVMLAGGRWPNKAWPSSTWR